MRYARLDMWGWSRNAHPLDLCPVPHGFVRTAPNYIRRCRWRERCECPTCNPGADAHSNHDTGDEDRS